jgi:hypothetical protein
MHKILVSVAAGVLVAGSSTASGQAAASIQAEVMAPARQFVDAFNKGDMKAAVAACVDATSIIDEFPPHEWHGTGACQRWMNDYDADSKKNGISDGLVTLGTPLHVDVTSDRAYIVIPAGYAFKRKGKPEKETGSMFTFAMHKGATGWRIVGWSWAKN